MADSLSAVVLSSKSNAAVVQLPGRKFPGMVIQGDSLHNLRVLVRELRDEVPAESEAAEIVDHLSMLISGYLAVYENTLKERGIELPYSEKSAR